jgi:tRNA threonylcarbamoyladenosine biosynthesis protein TsaB
LKILGIDTSTMMGAVGIIEDELLVAELRTNVSVTHSERLMLHVDALLKSAGLTLPDIDGFAVTVGPGSFTGLRIGLAAAKAMAYAAGKPLAGVPTLDVLADNLPYCKYLVAPVLDARKHMVYAAVFRPTDTIRKTLMPATVITPDELADSIEEPTVFLGEGAYVYRELLEGRLCCQALFAPKAYGYPSGAAVAFRGLKELNAGGGSDPMALKPLYIRKPDAEEKAGAGSH